MSPPRSAFARPLLYFVFFGSGAAALVYQAGWQRILTLHAGMDLYSVTTVIAAFMAGLGVGNLIGGNLSDRLSPARAVLLYAVVELLIGAFGWASTPSQFSEGSTLPCGTIVVWSRISGR